MEDRKHIDYLWSAYLNQNINARELEAFRIWLNNGANDDSSMEYLKAVIHEIEPLESYSEQRLQAILKKVREPISQSITSAEKLASVPVPSASPVSKVHFSKIVWVRYAATVLLLLGALAYYLLTNQPTGTKSIAKNSIDSIGIAPGKQGAILTLADGSTLVLDSLNDGIIANQSGTSVWMENGQLAYQANSAREVSYNVMTTPAGRQFRVVLPDGTKVWLNAKSTIKYPTAFIGNERRVHISGEAYLEVQQDKNKTFKVESMGQTVEVLGTHFNINCYAEEESVKTTLMEGMVRISSSGPNSGPANQEGKRTVVVLKPGEQSELNDRFLKVVKADVDEAMAWKNGKFEFNNEDIKSIMRKLARWYDIEVIYKGNFTGKTFTGSITMHSSISDILNKISFSKAVKFNVEGRSVTVML